MFVSFFFFFQAEDGIRDYKVTGVQTCALPIFLFLCGGAFDGLKKIIESRTGRRQIGFTKEELAKGEPEKLKRSEEHTSELQSPCNLVCRLLLEKKKKPTATNQRGAKD